MLEDKFKLKLSNPFLEEINYLIFERLEYIPYNVDHDIGKITFVKEVSSDKTDFPHKISYQYRNRDNDVVSKTESHFFDGEKELYLAENNVVYNSVEIKRFVDATPYIEEIQEGTSTIYLENKEIIVEIKPEVNIKVTIESEGEIQDPEDKEHLFSEGIFHVDYDYNYYEGLVELKDAVLHRDSDVEEIKGAVIFKELGELKYLS